MMKKDSLLKSTSLFSLATFLSRILGLVRESFVAAFLPGALQDVFLAGLRIPSTFRQLFAEGALSAAFIPLLSKTKEKEGEAQARELAFALFYFLIVVLTVLIAVAIWLAPYYIPILLDFPEEDGLWKIQASILTTQVLFPFLLFIALAAWAMGILNTHRYFFMPAVASAFLNISVIVSLLIGAYLYTVDPSLPDEAQLSTGMNLVMVVCAGVIFGGLLQFGVQLFQVRKVGYFPPKWTNPFHPRIKEMLYLLAPSVFGLAVYQINALITQTYFASKYGDGGISTMNYAFRLIQFPLGVVGIALATASFPRIAQYIAQERHEDASKTLQQVLHYLMLLMVPAAVGFVVLGHDIVGMIFNHGEFKAEGWLVQTYHILIFYSLGLLSYSAVSILARTSQAHHNFRLPVIAGIAGVTTNIVLCSLFVSLQLGVWSLALSAAIASTMNGMTIFISLKKSMTNVALIPMIGFGIRVLLAASCMGVVCWLVLAIIPNPDQSFLLYVGRVLLGMVISMLVYVGAGWLLFKRELMVMLRMK